jgi:hypothetical protein
MAPAVGFGKADSRPNSPPLNQNKKVRGPMR